MFDYDERGELAPRDVVARAIVDEMQRTKADCVYLDVTGLPPERTAVRFPQIMRYCAQYGLDITRDPIPVSPAAHYTMGGVRTNAWGETNIRNLYAAGECACTGVHGANRLASNSLLETIVFGRRIIDRTLEPNRHATALVEDAIALPQRSLSASGAGSASRAATAVAGARTALSLRSLQTLMWDSVGIVRDGDGLVEAVAQLADWEQHLPAAADRPSQELNNLVLAGRLCAEAALIRTESRGAHYRLDYPETSDAWRRHIVFRKDA
jgi:L-aspartate oxidase